MLIPVTACPTILHGVNISDDMIFGPSKYLNNKVTKYVENFLKPKANVQEYEPFALDVLKIIRQKSTFITAI